MVKVTREQLLAIMPNAKKRVDSYLSIINGWAEEFGINTKLRMAHYLAQIAHESGELRYTKESLGNTQPGDGVRFKGRGLIQITGRANYSAYANYCGFDVVRCPELLERPLGATKSSMWVFQKFCCNELADADNLKAIRKRINGGFNGLAQCEVYLERAKKALKI